MYQKILKNVIFGIESNYRAVIYLLSSMYLSIYCDFSDNSESYLAKQNNILNIYFVKFSWGWTLLSLGGYVIATTIENPKIQTNYTDCINVLLKLAIRLFIATMVWYFITESFLLVEEQTGVCAIPKYLDKSTCRNNGFFWKGFDISGHCFLLVWCNLVINEEIQGSGTLDMKEKVTVVMDTSSKNNSRHQFSFGPLFFYLLAFITMLWDLMIICTNMYFHTPYEKILGTVIAVSIWLVLYQFIYKKYLSKYLKIK